MFGKKKEEEWEFIGSDDYFQKEKYGQIADEEYRNKQRTSPEYLSQKFKSYLEDGEEILFTIGGVNNKKKTTGLRITVAVFLIGFILSFLLDFVAESPPWILEALSMFFSAVSLPILIMSGLVLYIRHVTNYSPNTNYVITSERILSDRYNMFNSIYFRNIMSVEAKVTGETMGNISVKYMDRPQSSRTCTIYDVQDPFGVKEIIDNAIEKFKADEARGR